MNNYYAVRYNNSYLAHHGVLGMKWGVRRYQNPDGSLTAYGRYRLNVRYGGQSKKQYRENRKQKYLNDGGRDISASIKSRIDTQLADRFALRANKFYRKQQKIYQNIDKASRKDDFNNPEKVFKKYGKRWIDAMTKEKIYAKRLKDLDSPSSMYRKTFAQFFNNQTKNAREQAYREFMEIRDMYEQVCYGSRHTD